MMKLNEKFPVRPEKRDALFKKIADLGINLSEIEERFVKGGGKGGQKINKTSNAVQLIYPPLNLRVKVQRERNRSLNRFLALRELVEKIENQERPGTSSRDKRIEKIRKQKSRRKRRRKQKDPPQTQ